MAVNIKSPKLVCDNTLKHIAFDEEFSSKGGGSGGGSDMTDRIERLEKRLSRLT